MKSKLFLPIITILSSLLLCEITYAKKPYSRIKQLIVTSKLPTKTLDLVRHTKFTNPQSDTGE